MDELLEDIKRIEYSKIEYDRESEDYFEFKEGNIPVLISAPHGAKHFREGKWKGEDEYTASIAIKLGEVTGAHVIYVKNKTREDSNRSEETKYKGKIKQIIEEYGIRFVADIHGVDRDKRFKICAGVVDDDVEKCSCPTFKGIIAAALRDFQEPPIFNRPLCKARGKGTVTSFARHTCGIESAQFEINAKYRIVERKPDSSKAKNGEEPAFRAGAKDVLELFTCLKELILRIKDEIEGQ